LKRSAAAAPVEQSPLGALRLWCWHMAIGCFGSRTLAELHDVAQ
jgi:hypothetical protein